MRAERRSALFGAGMLLLAACGGSRPPVPVAQVEPAPFEIRIHGAGELKAAQATPVEVPSTLNGRLRVTWLAEDGAALKEGDVVAQLDTEQLLTQMKEGREALSKLDRELEAKQTQLSRERVDLEGQLELLAREQADADDYAPRDVALFSRHEILDAQIDLDLIQSKVDHQQARLERYRKRAETELKIFELQRETERVKLSQLRQALENQEIRAPHDGFFLRGRTWQGERMRVGMTVWRGMRIGELPDVSQMEARIHVLESEAAGLAEGLEATIRLDAHPERPTNGKVKSVEPVANAIERESPVKYFEVLVDLDETDESVMRPASQVSATIFVAQEPAALAVPNQAIFHEGDETWVWVDRGGTFRKSPVSLGARSLSRTVVIQGLQAGDRVALVDPGDRGEEG